MVTRWNGNWGRGITFAYDRVRCWRVKFLRNGKWIYIGSFTRLPNAQAAAENFLRNEQCQSLTPS